MWPEQEAEKLRNISGWVDLLDAPVGGMGPTGIGGLLTFMDADLVSAYLPAWLVLAHEHPFPYAGILTALVVVLDNEVERDHEELERFQSVGLSLSSSQREFVAEVLRELADLHFRFKPDLRSRLLRVAEYRGLSEPGD